MAEITGGELLLKCLHAERVRHLIAIPDGTYNIVLEALQRRRDEFDCDLIVPRHEAAAAHMADAYTRVTGEPAVVMACAGPGAANLVSGVITAQAEGSPVVAITTTRRSDIAYPHTGAMQVAEQLAYFKPIVKWNAQVRDWRRIPDLVRQAFRVATSGRPGPVHLDIPENLLNQKGEEASAPVWERDAYRAGRGSVPEPALIRQAAELLVEAELLNLHCGSGALRSGAQDELQALAEHLGTPVTTGVGGAASSRRTTSSRFIRCARRPPWSTRAPTWCSPWERASVNSTSGDDSRCGASRVHSASSRSTRTRTMWVSIARPSWC